MPKFSQIPTNSNPSPSDFVVGVSAGGVDQKSPLAPRVVRTQIFTASGTYTPHANMVYAIIEAVGGGGGGGNAINASNYNLYAGGGGAGAYARKIVTPADIGASKAVTIGAGGAGNAAGATTLQNTVSGGDTSVGTLCVAKGGSNASYVQGGTQVSTAGSGGAATTSTGDVKVKGQGGFPGFYSGVVGQDMQFCGGNGGSTPFGAGAVGVINAAGPSADANSGAGGAGGSMYHGSPSAAGGNGGSGYVVITEFCTA